MPFFDYKCAECGYSIEKLTLGEPELFTWCSGCGIGRYLAKQVAAPKGFILKGNGFYKPSKEVGPDGGPN